MCRAREGKNYHNFTFSLFIYYLHSHCKNTCEIGRANRLGLHLPLKVSRPPLERETKQSVTAAGSSTLPYGCGVRCIFIISLGFLSRQKQAGGVKPGSPRHLFLAFLELIASPILLQIDGVSELLYSLTDAILCVGVSWYQETLF